MTSKKQSNSAFDLAVIGGGPAGYVAAICGARKGLRTVLIEKDQLGGTCLNRGCIPTKSFIYDSRLFKSARTTTVITGSEKLTLNFENMLARKRKVVSKLVSGVTALVKSNGVEVISGFAALKSAGRIEIMRPDGCMITVEAKNIVLANGSKPAVPAFIEKDGRYIQTTDDILDDPVFPDSILIIGGGVIGIEMATVFLNAGSKVIIVEMLPDILTTEDRDVRDTMKVQLEKQSASLWLETSVKELCIEAGKVLVTVEQHNDAHLEQIKVDKVLVATGRLPDLSGIDTKRLGLETNGPFLKVSPCFETNLPHVYAIGDLIGGMMLAHKACAEAEAVVENIMGAAKSISAQRIPRCIWGLLEVGAVGLSEEEAKRTGRKIKTGRFPLAASGAAAAMGHIQGFVKVVGDADTGEILGVHILGEHATDMIAEAVTVMQMEGAVEDLWAAVKPHPTLSEALLEAALDWSDKAIHLPRKKHKTKEEK